MSTLLRSDVGLVSDDRYLLHNPGQQANSQSGDTLPFVEPVLHPSNYRLVWRTKHLLELTGLTESLQTVVPYQASTESLTTYHSLEYVNRVRELCANGGGDAGRGAPVSPESWKASLLAAGGVMASVDAVMEDDLRRVFANVRPPGHHAMADKGMGFCIFNNVALAAKYAQTRYGLERIMILDWDVHVGNGTQNAFHDDSSVLFVSLHQDQLAFHDYGQVDQVGVGEGVGFTVNIPLPPGSGDAAYEAAFEQLVQPIADQFSPQLVLISAGQDASVMDALGRMCVTTEGYRQMTRSMIKIAEQSANGRLIVVQEGGYSEVYAPYCTLAIIETLLDTRTELPEPIPKEKLTIQPHTHEVGSSQKAFLAKSRSVQRYHWRLDDHG